MTAITLPMLVILIFFHHFFNLVALDGLYFIQYLQGYIIFFNTYYFCTAHMFNTIHKQDKVDKLAYCTEANCFIHVTSFSVFYTEVNSEYWSQ